MISNKFAEGFDMDSSGCNVSSVPSLYVSDNGHRKVSRSPSPRPSGFRRTKHPDESQEDYLASRVTFYMDEMNGGSNCDTDDSSPDLRKPPRKKKRSKSENQELFPEFHVRKSEKSSSKREQNPSKDTSNEDLRRQISFKKLQGQVSEALSRERSLKRNASWRVHPTRGSRQESVEPSVSRSTSRSQHSRSGSCRGKPPSGIERQNSVQSHAPNYRRSSNTRLAEPPRSESRKSSSFSERFDLPHKNLPPKERRRRTVVLIVIITFLFLVVSSVLVVIITLTNSTFHGNTMPDESSQLYNQTSLQVRKENEQLLNSMNRDDNLYTASPTASTYLEVTPPSD